MSFPASRDFFNAGIACVDVNISADAGIFQWGWA